MTFTHPFDLNAVNRKRLISMAQRIVGPDDAEDVVQEAFLAAWKYRTSFKGDSTMQTWMYRIVKNKAFGYKTKDVFYHDQSERLFGVMEGDLDTDGFAQIAFEQVLREVPTNFARALYRYCTIPGPLSNAAAVDGLPYKTFKTRINRAQAYLV